MSSGQQIIQTGTVTPGHALTWTTDGVAQDGGPATAGNASEIVITRDGGIALGINSGVTTGPFVEYGVGVASDGTITIFANSFNSAPSASIVYNINGVSYPFTQALTPAQLTALILLATTSTSGAMPALSGNPNQFLNGDGEFTVPSGGGGGTSPGGTTGEIQFNNAGMFGGLTDTQLTTHIQTFTPSLSGSVPAPGSSTGRVLNDAGDWVSAPTATLATLKWYNVTDFGAVGDGVTNDTAAFNSAASAAASGGGGVVLVPPKFFRIDPIILPNSVCLCGTLPGPFDPAVGNVLTTPMGPTLLVNSHASPFITVGTNGALLNVVIYDPGQVSPTASAPTVFPATVYAPNGACRIRGITILNGYIGISVLAGRVYIEDCYINAYQTGVDVDSSQDFVHITNVLQSVFWDICVGLSFPQAIDTWVINNSRAFRFARQDGALLVNCSTFYRYVNVLLIQGSTGSSYGLGTNIWCDTCTYGVVAQQTSFNGWVFSNLRVTPSSIGQTAIWCNTGTPIVRWNGGSVDNLSSFEFGAYQVMSGQCYVRGVSGLPDFTTSGVPISIPAPLATVFTVTSIILDPGDWEIWGEFSLTVSGSCNSYTAGVSSNSSVMPTASTGLAHSLQVGGIAGGAYPGGHGVVSPATITQYFLVGFVTGSSITAGGFIGAKRV
jgi:hypothetical protein